MILECGVIMQTTYMCVVLNWQVGMGLWKLRHVLYWWVLAIGETQVYACGVTLWSIKILIFLLHLEWKVHHVFNSAWTRVFNESVQEICGFHVQWYSLSWICMYIYIYIYIYIYKTFNNILNLNINLEVLHNACICNSVCIIHEQNTAIRLTLKTLN